LLDNKYSILPEGIPGNDDYGTLTAWYFFASMGFFPLAGSDIYIIGSPQFDKLVINHSNGVLTLISYNNTKENVFVDKIHLNGVLYNSRFLTHSQLMDRSISLEFWMKI